MSLSLFFSISVYLHASLKTKLFCDIATSFQADNIKTEAIVRDFLKFCTRQRQKWSNSARQQQERSNSARLPSKMESWVQSWRPRTNAFCDFSDLRLYSIAPATKNWCQVIRGAAPVMQNHLPKTEDLMLQNATTLRKSAPWPPNMSDEHVSCTAPATRNASLQILCKCPTPAILFSKCYTRSVHFWQGAESLAPATQNHIWTFKNGPSMWCF